MQPKRPMPACLAAALASVLIGPDLAAQETSSGRIFTDGFAGGRTHLEWRPYPPFDGGAVEGRTVESAPDGDGAIGVLRHSGGGLATIGYADTVKAEDTFTVEAHVYCPRDAEGRDGSLTGLAFYLRPLTPGEGPEEGGFYRMVCDYRFGSGGFSLAYLGANIARQPLELEFWPLIEQEVGRGDGWRRIRIAVEQGLIEIYMNDVKLNERPIPAERVITDIANIDAGYAGIYAGHLGGEGTAEARIDGFRYVIP